MGKSLHVSLSDKIEDDILKLIGKLWLFYHQKNKKKEKRKRKRVKAILLKSKCQALIWKKSKLPCFHNLNWKVFLIFLLFLNIYLSYIPCWQNERVKIDTKLCGFIGERFFLYSSQFWGKFPFMFNLKIYRNISLIQKQSSKHFFSPFSQKSPRKSNRSTHYNV